MAHLGHARFAVVGHDRGALVAFRTAMDYPDLVSHLGQTDEEAPGPVADAIGEFSRPTECICSLSTRYHPAPAPDRLTQLRVGPGGR